MPLVKIEVAKGHTEEYKKKMFEAVFEGLSNALSVPRENLMQRIFEWEPGSFELTPGKSEKFVLVEVTLLPGRDSVLKKSVITEITRMLGKLCQIQPQDVFIVLHDPPKENWGHNGLQATEW
jgi:phenylpyruvate tautomerase PptA (4-oxalocrotonate tautomerase family)